MPASRAASMAVMVEPPVVQTSSTMTTWRALLQEAFDAASGAVRFFGFADQEAVDEGGGWVGAGFEVEFAGELEHLGVVGERPGAGAGGVGDQRVGAHGEAADGFGLGDVLADEVVEDEAGEAAAFGVERGGAAVDVVVGLLAAGEGEVAEFEGEGGDEVEQVGAGIVWHGLFDCRWYPPGAYCFCAKSSIQRL